MKVMFVNLVGQTIFAGDSGDNDFQLPRVGDFVSVEGHPHSIRVARVYHFIANGRLGMKQDVNVMLDTTWRPGL